MTITSLTPYTTINLQKYQKHSLRKPFLLIPSKVNVIIKLHRKLQSYINLEPICNKSIEEFLKDYTLTIKYIGSNYMSGVRRMSLGANPPLHQAATTVSVRPRESARRPSSAPRAADLSQILAQVL